MFQMEDILDIEKMIDAESLNCDNESIARIKSFIKDYKIKSSRLEKILKISDKQQLEILKLNSNLENYKIKLEKLFEEEKEKNKYQEALLVEQSKNAAMGQMIDSIAHQWSQPLSVIQLLNDSLIYDFYAQSIDEDFIKSYQADIARQVKHLTSTLQEFRDFYRPDKESTLFDVKNTLEKVLLLQKDEFIKNQIEFKLDIKDNFTINGIENEFKHLFINLFNNARDAFLDNNIEQKKYIIIRLSNKEESKQIEIIDNAGGIPEKILDKIFNLNFTTKQKDKGTGVGLHLCKQIIEKHNGFMEVDNFEDGAKFTLNFNH